MKFQQPEQIEKLIKQSGENGEIIVRSGDNNLRIDVRSDDISLWRSHFLNHSSEDNLLIACEDRDGELMHTRLTWVVGSSIRSAFVSGKEEAQELLEAIGVVSDLARLACNSCYGLGESTIWAIYFDRNKTLSATPLGSCL
jgi:cysteine sulfinate desulfinase/cysteine desulfurase-like protein